MRRARVIAFCAGLVVNPAGGGLSARAEQGQSTSSAIGGVAVGRDSSGWDARIEQAYDPVDALRFLGALQVSRRASSPYVVQGLVEPAWCFACGDRVRAFAFAGGGPAVALGGTAKQAWADLDAAAGLGLTWRCGWGWGLRAHAEATMPLGLSSVTDRARDAQLDLGAGLFLEY